MTRRRGYHDPFPRLPPGVTPSDIPGNRPQDQPCRWCDRLPQEGHSDTCPMEEMWCDVCKPPADEYRTFTGDPVFCENHDEEDLRAKEEAIEDNIQEPGPPMVPPEDER